MLNSFNVFEVYNCGKYLSAAVQHIYIRIWFWLIKFFIQICMWEIYFKISFFTQIELF